MARYSQSGRPLSISTPLGSDVLLLEQFSGTEEVSNPFVFRLSLLAEQPIDFAELLRQPASISWTDPNGTKRTLRGIIRSISQGSQLSGPQGSATFIRYWAELVPAFWLLTLRVQSRIFQQRTVLEIVKTILGDEWQLDIKVQCLRNYQPRNYCVQYQESDFAFVSRLLEEEGISYLFPQENESGVLTFVDSPQSFPQLPEPSTVAYRGHTTHRSVPSIRRWIKTQSVRPIKQTVRDYTFQMPQSDLTASANVSPDVQMGSVTHRLGPTLTINGTEMLETSSYPAPLVPRFDGISPSGNEQSQELQKIWDEGKRLARIRAERETIKSVHARGASNCAHFAAGHTFTLSRHFDGDARYTLIRVKHQASIRGAYKSAEDKPLIYRNRFMVIPASLPYRPPCRTPWPRIDGLQTAFVTGPSDSEIYLDKFGRVQVRFHWDKQKDSCSCWIRVAQFWAGKNWGAFFWPRVGHEVVVAFEEGHPDRPIIVGSVYNAVNGTPLALPSSAKLTGIQSHIFNSEGATKYNAVIFHDVPDDEYLQLHSEKNEVTHNKNGKIHYVGSSVIHLHGKIK